MKIPAMEIRAFEVLRYSAFIRLLGSSINLEISTSGSQARNRHTQSQHRMGRRPMHSSGISELRIRDVLTRVLPQIGHFIRSRSSEPESLFQLGLVSPAASIAEAESAAKLAINPAGEEPADRTYPVAVVVISDGRKSDRPDRKLRSKSLCWQGV